MVDTSWSTIRKYNNYYLYNELLGRTRIMAKINNVKRSWNKGDVHYGGYKDIRSTAFFRFGMGTI